MCLILSVILYYIFIFLSLPLTPSIFIYFAFWFYSKLNSIMFDENIGKNRRNNCVVIRRHEYINVASHYRPAQGRNKVSSMNIHFYAIISKQRKYLTFVVLYQIYRSEGVICLIKYWVQIHVKNVKREK
jgi:hypothetical protein